MVSFFPQKNNEQQFKQHVFPSVGSVPESNVIPASLNTEQLFRRVQQQNIHRNNGESEKDYHLVQSNESMNEDPTFLQQSPSDEIRRYNMDELFEEDQHFERVYTAFRQYATFSRFARRGWQHRISSLPHSLSQYLPIALRDPNCPQAKQREQLMQDAEIRNQFLLDCILRYAGVPTSQDILPGTSIESGYVHSVWSTEEAISKVGSVLKSLARDWSEDGEEERNSAYKPILEAIQRYLPLNHSDASSSITDDPDHDDTVESPKSNFCYRVCVPGAGVGRLALEIRSLGYEVQGNEFSSYMLLASNFLLNGGANPLLPFRISPYLTETRNVTFTANPAREIRIPDCDVVQMIEDSTRNQHSIPDFSMVAGDFVSVYSDTKNIGTWHCVACCFFLDTAPCIVEYFKVIYTMLENGGILVNFGPLLYHWSGPPLTPSDKTIKEYEAKHRHLDARYLNSIDLSWEDARTALINVGFQILEESLLQSTYTSDRTSLMSTDFKCIYFVAKKTVSTSS